METAKMCHDCYREEIATGLLCAGCIGRETARRAALPCLAQIARNPNHALPMPMPMPRTQLWEPCDRCGQEPCYATTNGNLCARCDHPLINIDVENSREPMSH